MEQIDQKIIDKIQKLLNLKEGAEAVGNYHEAENAAARVSEFLLKYNLDLETVQKSTIEKKADMTDICIDTSQMADKRESGWVPKLYVAIARNNLCEIFTFTDKEVRIFGHKTNVMMVAYIAEQMIAKIRIAEKLSWKDYEEDGGYEKRGTFRRGFFDGATAGIYTRLRRQKEEMTKGDDNPFAIMVINKEKELNDYMIEQGWRSSPEEIEEYKRKQKELMADPNYKPPKPKKSRPLKGPKGLSSNDGWHSGYEAGKNMDINKGMNSPSVKGHL
jgi:hypothetical protein